MKYREDLLESSAEADNWVGDLHCIPTDDVEEALDSIVSDLQELLGNIPKEEVFIELANIIDRWGRE